ncbi:DUF1643 domain-containing protein [Bacillus spizizenii]|nr:DUF1643 domain-containing protein [Bacillus spizizenii]
MSKKPYPDFVIKESIVCDCKDFLNTNIIRTRKMLIIELNNEFKKTITFTLMNPSRANKTDSDKTVNLLLKYAKVQKAHTVIITNVYPFYEPRSPRLRIVLSKAEELDSVKYENTFKENLNIIKDAYSKSDKIYVLTGNPIRAQRHRDTLRCLRGYGHKVYGLKYKKYSHLSKQNCVYHLSYKAYSLKDIEEEFLYYKKLDEEKYNKK